MSTWCGNDPVEECFDEEEHGRVGSDVFWVVEKVSAHGHTGEVGPLFLNTHRAYKLDLCVIVPASAGNFRFMNELYDVAAFYASSNSLGEATIFIGGRDIPAIFESRVT